MRNRIPAYIKQQVINDYRFGKRWTDIITEYRIGGSTLYRLVRNVKQRTDKKDIRRKLTEKQEESVVRKYEDGETSAQLARYLSCSDKTILETLRRYGVKARRTGPIEVSVEARKSISKAVSSRWANESYRRDHLPILKSVAFKKDGKKNDSYTYTVRYRKFRDELISIRGYKCEKCKLVPKLLDIHHVKAVKEYPELIWEESNILLLCRRCHMKEDALMRRLKAAYV